MLLSPYSFILIHFILFCRTVNLFSHVLIDQHRKENYLDDLDTDFHTRPFSLILKHEICFPLFCPGASQSTRQSTGPLATVTTVGNLRRLSLNTANQTGSWEISVNSNSPYSVKVTGQ